MTKEADRVDQLEAQQKDLLAALKQALAALKQCRLVPGVTEQAIVACMVAIAEVEKEK